MYDTYSSATVLYILLAMAKKENIFHDVLCMIEWSGDQGELFDQFSLKSDDTKDTSTIISKIRRLKFEDIIPEYRTVWVYSIQ